MGITGCEREEAEEPEKNSKRYGTDIATKINNLLHQKRFFGTFLNVVSCGA